MTSEHPQRPRPRPRPVKKSRGLFRRNNAKTQNTGSQVRRVDKREQKPSKLLNTYIPRFISDTQTGGFFKRYHFERYYIYIITLTILSIIYIANTFETHKLYYYEASLNEQIKELRAKSLTISSIKMTRTRESAVYNEIVKRNIPLVYPSTPPLVIEVPKQQKQTFQSQQ